MKTLQEAQEATQQFFDTLKGNGFTLEPVIQAQNSEAKAIFRLREMTRTEHEAYLESIKPEIVETKK